MVVIKIPLIFKSLVVMKISLFRKKCCLWKYFYRRLSGAGAEKSVIVSAPALAKKGGSGSATLAYIQLFEVIFDTLAHLYIACFQSSPFTKSVCNIAAPYKLTFPSKRFNYLCDLTYFSFICHPSFYKPPVQSQIIRVYQPLKRSFYPL